MLRMSVYGFSIAALVLFLAAFQNSAAAATGEDAALFGEVPAVEDEALGAMRGAALAPELLGIAVFDAMSTNNTSIGTVSGGNTINAGAFSQSSGLSTIIQNSGNNVLIQSATILNVSID